MDHDVAGAKLASHAAKLLRLAAEPRAQPNPTVAAYAGVGDEPPTRQLLDALASAGARVILPVVTDHSAALAWAPYDGWDALATVRWG
ncbi:MAG: hypothetical protein JO074_06460, partial [Frankiales bacterium]|nr:hypothetical protein [Frankiales bacterium]